MSAAYHSALQPVAKPAPSAARYDSAHGSAFTWDVARFGLPPAMRDADILYGDPPWLDGYTKFALRAGIEQSVSWNVFMTMLGKELRSFKRPAVMVVGKSAIRLLNPERAVPCTLNKGSAWAASWGDVWPAPGSDSVEILTDLALKYNVVGDPFCGYGRSGRIFKAAGKRYIMSDVSPECIGRIMLDEGSWT